MVLVGDPCNALPSDEIQFSYETEVLAVDWNQLMIDSEGETRWHPALGGTGLLVSTGIGDGLYPVQVRLVDCGDWGTRVAELRIVFLPYETKEL
jgi:hypothetical protein